MFRIGSVRETGRLRAPRFVTLLAVSLLSPIVPSHAAPAPGTVRIASFNVSLYRDQAGQLREHLTTGEHAQIRDVVAVLQKIRPDIVLLNEFDYDEVTPPLLLRNYLQVPQAGEQPLDYPHYFIAPSNTGVPSGVDLDGNGCIEGPNDALGFGRFPGQYGMLLLSRFPIERSTVRTFKDFLWRDMPGNSLPPGWYSDAALAVLPLSSKSHWDVPVIIDGTPLHVLASHPTPPGFDGPEDRNGRRNHDEIRLWADYITGGRDADYLRDDLGRRGGLATDTHFVIVGDLNADPVDGSSRPRAISQLLEHPRVHREAAIGKLAPRSEGGRLAAERQAGPNLQHRGDPSLDTGDFSDGPGSVGNLRVDYVLPSAELTVCASGVYWPVEDNGPAYSTDHRLVWVDIALPGQGCSAVSSKP